MKILVTGSSGHLGEALVRTLEEQNHEVLGIDLLASEYTDKVGSITDTKFVKECMKGIDTVFHTAALHKPHIITHSRNTFVETNIIGTLNLLEAAILSEIHSFIFTSTTSVFGRALMSSEDSPAVWITEDVVPIPKNIYGITKFAAENLCQLFYQKYHLPCIILRTSRFFPEEDDRKVIRDNYEDENVKLNEFLYRRVDIEDVVSAHLLAMEKAKTIGSSCYIISATTPFTKEDLFELRINAAEVLKRKVPEYEEEYNRRGWKMFQNIDRVYFNRKAQDELDWKPKHDFMKILGRIESNGEILSPLAKAIGSKGYHSTKFSEYPYPVEDE